MDAGDGGLVGVAEGELGWGNPCGDGFVCLWKDFRKVLSWSC